MQIEDALAQFVRQLEADGRSIHTVKQYRRHVRRLARWTADVGHSGHVEDLDHTVIARFMTATHARVRPDGRPKKATSVNALRSSLRVFCAYLHDVGLTSSNAARQLRRARSAPPPPRPIPDEDLRQLLATLRASDDPRTVRDLAIFRLLAESGMRLGSAVALDVADLDLDRQRAHLRTAKGDHRQTVVLPAPLCEHLRTYAGGRRTGPLFLGRNGGPLSARQVQQRLCQWLERAGVERHSTVHSLRHRFALRLYRATGDLRLVQQALGHRSITSTTVYARADISRLAAALG